MVKAKIDFKSIMLLVMSVLLVMAVSTAATFAWFADQDSQSSRNIIMSDPLTVEINVDGSNQVPVEIPGDFLLPGMKITPDLKVTVKESNTKALLRVQVGFEGISEETLNTAISGAVIGSNWAYYDGWWYFIGGQANTAVMTSHYEDASGLVYGTAGVAATPATPIENTVMASIDSSETNVVISFLNTNAYFRLPVEITQDEAGESLTLNFTAQVIQDYIVNSALTSTVLPTITEAARVFAVEFPA